MSLSITTGPMFAGKCLEENTPVTMRDMTHVPLKDLKVGDVLLNGNRVICISGPREADKGWQCMYGREIIVTTLNHWFVKDGKPIILNERTYIENWPHVWKGEEYSMWVEPFNGPFTYREVTVSGNNMIPVCTGLLMHNTTTLIKDHRTMNGSKIVVRHKQDNRFDADSLTAAIMTTHDGLKYGVEKMIMVSNLKEAHTLCADYDNIIVDEIQFFSSPDDLQQVKNWMFSGKHVWAYGLISDFRGKPFGLMPEYMAIATDVRFLKGNCNFCGKDATFNFRTIKSDDITLVGGAEMYNISCISCLNKVDHPLLDSS